LIARILNSSLAIGFHQLSWNTMASTETDFGTIFALPYDGGMAA
jgi:hypothetical protein